MNMFLLTAMRYSVNIVLMNVIEKYFPKEHRERVSEEEDNEKTEQPLKNGIHIILNDFLVLKKKIFDFDSTFLLDHTMSLHLTFPSYKNYLYNNITFPSSTPFFFTFFMQ